MSQLIGLFSNQTDAEQALADLTAAGVRKSDLQMMVVTPGTAVANSFNLTNQTAHTFRQKTQNGGVLVIVNRDNNQPITQVKDILQQNSLTIAASDT